MKVNGLKVKIYEEKPLLFLSSLREKDEPSTSNGSFLLYINVLFQKSDGSY